MSLQKATNTKLLTRPSKPDSRLENETIENRSQNRVVLGRLLRVLVLAVLLTVIAAPSLAPKYSVVDNDLWLHLKTGDWIVEQQAFPHTGILSRTAADPLSAARHARR